MNITAIRMPNPMRTVKFILHSFFVRFGLAEAPSLVKENSKIQSFFVRFGLGEAPSLVKENSKIHAFFVRFGLAEAPSLVSFLNQPTHPYTPSHFCLV